MKAPWLHALCSWVPEQVHCVEKVLEAPVALGQGSPGIPVHLVTGHTSPLATECQAI